MKERVYMLSSGNEQERQAFLQDLHKEQEALKAKKKKESFLQVSEDRQVLFYLRQIERCTLRIKKIIQNKREKNFFNTLSSKEKKEIDYLVDQTMTNMESRAFKHGR